MGPLEVFLVGLGGAVAGAGIHKIGVDQGYQSGYLNALPQGRREGFVLGFERGRHEATAEIQQLRADMAEMKALVQQLLGTQQVAELAESVKKALQSDGWGELWNSNGGQPEG